jgi:hypothetical protein
MSSDSLESAVLMEEFLMTGKNCGREAINDDGEKIFPENDVQQDRKKDQNDAYFTDIR